MVIIDGLSEIEYEGGTRVVIGKFDGIHAGHKKLIHMITDKHDDLKSVVFTFSYDSELFNGKAEQIYDAEERRKRFSELGIDYLVEYLLDEKACKMEPEDFARILLKDRLHAREIVCGPDLSFGYKGRGNVELLRSMEKDLGIKVCVVEKVKYQGEDISSTRIRNAILRGDLLNAENMLRG